VFALASFLSERVFTATAVHLFFIGFIALRYVKSIFGATIEQAEKKCFVTLAEVRSAIGLRCSSAVNRRTQTEHIVKITTTR
jgi:hypothetical protein